MQTFNIEKLFLEKITPYNNGQLPPSSKSINYLFPNRKQNFDINKRYSHSDFFYVWGTKANTLKTDTISEALKNNSKVYICEDCFLRCIVSWIFNYIEPKFQTSVGYTIDDITAHYDCSMPSRLEQMLNNPDLVITNEQKERARLCINKLIKNNISKYNNQPIYTPNIGRNGVKKVLVIDQSYGDYSIVKGGGSEELFTKMLQKAIEENPSADIIIKTHPDTLSGKSGCYYSHIKEHDNVYKLVKPINPISLIQYVDKVYVCTSQFGFEALMCGKEVHVFGIPFYQGWGLTIDEQTCKRRTNKRTLEEIFYIAYIIYSHYVNPEKECSCEIEEAIDYLIKLRKEYFES